MKELEQTGRSVPKGKRFCTICGEVKRLHYFEGDSTHCSACCENMLHTRLNVRCIPFVLILLAVIACSVFLSVQTVPYCKSFLSAQQAVRDKRLSDACELYALAIADASERNAALLAHGKTQSDGSLPAPTWTFFEAGAYTWARYLDLYAMTHSAYDASYLAQGSLDADLSARIPAIAELYEERQAYDETLSFAEETANAYPETEEGDSPYDDIIRALTAHADESDSRFVKGYTEFYKGRAAQYFRVDDPSVAAAYYSKLLDYMPKEFMIVYTAQAEAALDGEDYALAIEAYERILEKNKNETDAYISIAGSAFLAGDEEKLAQSLSHFEEDDPQRLSVEMRCALRGDDLDAAEAVRQRAQQTTYKKADTIFNQMLAEQTISEDNRVWMLNFLDYVIEDAALSLVQGDEKEAYRLAYDVAFNDAYYYAYLTNDSGAFSQSLINIATLCASLVKDQDALKTIREVGESDATTQSLISGELKLTMRDIFVDGKAEII